jgi:hypothetical protein
MNSAEIRQEFKGRVSEQIDLEQEGVGRFLVNTPFRFEDGDHFAIFLKREAEGWILSDEASTLMHLSYWLDDKAIESGNRQEIVNNSLSCFSVENRNGELVIPVLEERFGDALFNFVQALTKVTDISFLSREIVRSTFVEDFKSFIRTVVPEGRYEFDWNDQHRDAKGHYPVDCRINHMKRPLLVYALPGAEKVSVATISLLTFEKWNIPFQSLGIYEEQESIQPKAVARFSDVVDKAFSNLEGNKDRIAAYLKRALEGEPSS